MPTVSCTSNFKGKKESNDEANFTLKLLSRKDS